MSAEFKPHNIIPSWFVKLMGSAVGILGLLLVVACGGIVYLVHKHEMTETARDRRMDIMMLNFQILHEQVTLREIVAERLPNLSIETQAKIALEVYEAHRTSGAPSWIFLAMIEKESGWNWKITAGSGALGLMQLMPGTAITMARAEGGTVTSVDQMLDPVNNVRWGIRKFLDDYRGAVLQGKSPEGDFTRALWFYNGKGEAYARLVMEHASAYQKRLAAPLSGKIPTPKES